MIPITQTTINLMEPDSLQQFTLLCIAGKERHRVWLLETSKSLSKDIICSYSRVQGSCGIVF